MLHLETLYGHVKAAGARLLLRAVLDGAPPQTALVDLGDPAPVRAFVEKHITERNLFVGVAVRKPDAATGSGADCLLLPALFTEIDFKDFASEAEALERLAKFPLPPSLLIRSGGGLHVYWLLVEPLSLEGTGFADAKALLVALAKATGGDLKAAEPARVLRPAGTWNRKYDPPRPVTIDTLDATRIYAIDDIRAAVAYCAEPATTSKGERKPPLPDVIGSGTRNDVLFREACRLFAQGYHYNEVRALIGEANKRSVRPLAGLELDSLTRSAEGYPVREVRPLNEVGDAQSFAADVRDRVRHDHARKADFLFDTHWRPDTDAQIHRDLQEHIKTRIILATRIEDSTVKAATLKHLGRCQSAARLDAILKIARTQKPLAMSGTEWDRDPMLFGCANGTIDLSTGVLRPGDPNDLITQFSPVPYDPAAAAPRAERFFLEIFGEDEALVNYMWRVLGYVLTGLISAQVFWILWGGGGNGKSTLMELITYILGPYAWGMPFPSAHWSESMGEYQKASLAGRRLVTSAEVSQRAQLHEELVKSLTGGDTINARHPYGRPFNFVPSAKFFLRVNDRPIIQDTTRGMWRRVKLVPFTQSFPVNPTLADELRAEAPGVLAWMVRGCLAWQRDGFQEPEIVRVVTEEYRAEQDPLATFLAECCVLAPNASVGGQVFYQRYLAWCETSFVPSQQRMSAVLFGRKVAERFKSEKTKSGRFYYGVGLLEARQNTPPPDLLAA